MISKDGFRHRVGRVTSFVLLSMLLVVSTSVAAEQDSWEEKDSAASGGSSAGSGSSEGGGGEPSSPPSGGAEPDDSLGGTQDSISQQQGVEEARERRQQEQQQTADAEERLNRAIEGLNGEELTVDRALDLVERGDVGRVSVSMNSDRQDEAFRDNNGQGPAPVVFPDRNDDSLRFDDQRLTREQRRRLEQILVDRAVARFGGVGGNGDGGGGGGGGSVDGSAPTQPKEAFDPTQPQAPVSSNAVGPGNFGPEDVAFGLAKAGRLVKFAGKATPGTRAPLGEETRSLPLGKERDKAIARDTVAFVKETLQKTGGTLRFNLEGFDVKGALDPKSAVFNKITSAELRLVLSDPALLERTRFYDTNGKEFHAVVSGSDLSNIRFVDSKGVDVTSELLASAGGS